jgi:single-stranded DNA-specific DHH superfamily exonuclease
MKTIKVQLSNSGIEQLIKKFEQLNKDLEEASKKSVEDMAELCEKQIINNYASSPYTDGNDDVSFINQEKDKKRRIGVEGSQVLYREFGTGTEGLNAPHPIKKQYNLKGYNSGEKIKVNSKNGELYWIYKDKSGNAVYTQGIPAGKEVYNAAIILKGKKLSIIKKRVGDALSKL